jgi:hypothetical protein
MTPKGVRKMLFLGYFEPDEDEKVNDKFMDDMKKLGYLVEPTQCPRDPYDICLEIEVELPDED